MKATRVSIDLLSFQQLCRGEVACLSGFIAGVQEGPVELSLQDIGFEEMAKAVAGGHYAALESAGLMEQDHFLDTLDVMEDMGGSFVKLLAGLARRGDRVNKIKCMIAWPEYFLEYEKMVPARA